MSVLLSSCQGLANFYAPGEVLNKVFHRKAPPQGLTPHPFLTEKATPLVRPTNRARAGGRVRMSLV